MAFMIMTCIYDISILTFGSMQQGTKRMPGIAVTKSVVATEPGGRRREEIFVDIIEKISITFSSSVSTYILDDSEFHIGLLLLCLSCIMSIEALLMVSRMLTDKTKL